MSPLPGWTSPPRLIAPAPVAPLSRTERLRQSLRDWPVWLASVALHALLLLIFSLVVLKRSETGINFEALLGEFNQVGTSIIFDNAGLDLDLVDANDDEPHRDLAAAGGAPALDEQPVDLLEPSTPDIDSLALPAPEGIAPEAPRDPKTAGGRIPAGRRKSTRTSPRQTGNLAADGTGINLTGILEGRGAGERARLAKAGGGNKASEDAVELGLKWLARHQRSDGSWSFRHGPDDPGALDCPTGATGLALLAFLGAGYTHQEGTYRSHVGMGLRYLIDQMDSAGSQGWLLGTGQATMYTQGIGAIALCEAYTMTHDRTLRRPAQAAIDFIAKAQDPQGGGWRYRIPQAGDTSVHGWQLMALKSAIHAELEVPSQVMIGATHFLDSVEVDGGSQYAYIGGRMVRPSTTAVGLLCRMYLGRPQAHPGLTKGMRNLSNWGPNIDDMYYSYYATQAMHHWGGGQWTKWNSVMRDQIVNRQAKKGDLTGSWKTDQSHGSSAGGRLYTTCLSIMTLEVYYRYLPIYKRKVLNTDPQAEQDL